MAQITSLFVYPVKSCRGVSVQKAYIAPTGVLHVSLEEHKLLLEDDRRELVPCTRFWGRLVMEARHASHESPLPCL